MIRKRNERRYGFKGNFHKCSYTMRELKVLILAIALALGAVVVAGSALGLGVGVIAETNETEEETTAPNESNLGAQVSSFAQASAADANTSVDTGMWEAGVNDSDNPAAAVDNRTNALFDRLERLQERSDDLEAKRDNGTINEQAYEARASAIRSQIANVEYKINHTEQTASNVGVGVDETKLNELRSNAANMTGPEVSALARNITDAPRGPPAHAGPGNETGPPDHAGPDNETDNGPPEHTGQNNESDTGPPDHAGQSDDYSSDSDTSSPALTITTQANVSP